MLDSMYKMVTPWATANKVQVAKNRIIGRIANYLYPAYCSICPVRNNESKFGKKTDTIISLTSFPARINRIHLCINSLLRQTKSADQIVLWLAKSQFPQIEDVPAKLRKLEDAGLQIKFCDDIRSYKKIFYTAQKYPDSTIITADDDTLYPESWLEGLLRKAEEYSGCVVCYRAHKIVLKDGEVAPYKEWIGMSPGETGPDTMLIPIGVGGVLYPAGYFSNVDFDIEIIRKLCPTADDLWLKAIGVKNGYSTVKVNAYSKEWFTIKASQKENLMQYNVGENENDDAMHNLVKYYDIDWNDIEMKDLKILESYF